MSMTNNPTQSVDEVVEELHMKLTYVLDQPEAFQDVIRNKLTTLQTQHEKELREERERIKQWSIKELAPIQEQLQTERYSEVREYLIGQRNKLFDLQQALTDNK